jgi:uncharacterized LabA/DUF88 family protein
VSKNVAVFVDVANIFYAAKAAGADIDYVTLLKAAVAGRDFVRAYAYTGLDPENENQRNFHSFLARHGYKVVSKDIRKYGDGKVKANLDIELVVDMMKTARNLDVAIVVSGDGDFAPAIRAVQEMGVRVEVISFRGNTSSDLMDVADIFYDITQLARVDRDSTRSGRRVAGDDQDLSMTEVPDKQTEGRGGRRGRGRGRPIRDGVDEPAPVEARGGRSAGRGVPSRTAQAPLSGGHLVALPGEKLSRAAGAEEGEFAAPDGELVDEEILAEAGEIVEGAEGEAAEAGAEAGHRRRRRGGRGRGHGRAQGTDEAGEFVEGDAAESEEGEVAASPKARPGGFGSVWDSQIGMDTRPARLTPISQDEDDYAEPEIPEYLLAERRRSGAGGNRGGRGQGGGRGVRSAYASAVERERYGGRGTSSPYPQPQPQASRQAQPPRRRDDRPVRQPLPQQHRGGGGMPRSGGRDSAEPWSEVPPELEELLRAQLSTKLSRQGNGETAPTHDAAPVFAETEAAETKAKPASRSRRKPAAEAAESGESQAPSEAPTEKAKPATRSRRKPAAAAAEIGDAGTAGEAPAGEAPAGEAPAGEAPAGEAPAGEAPAGEAPAGEPAAPKKRAPARRKTAAAAAAAGEAIAGSGDASAGDTTAGE